MSKHWKGFKEYYFEILMRAQAVNIRLSDNHGDIDSLVILRKFITGSDS